MNIPTCKAPDPDTHKPKYRPPPGACDAHCHIFGPGDRYPYAPDRSYTPPDAPLSRFKELQSILPDVPGWEKNHPEAERMTAPVSFSYASTKYKKGNIEVTEKITDSGFNQLLVAPISMMLAAGYAKQSTEGFEKSTTIAGYPAFEKWDKSDKNSQLTVFVNQRFLVELEGSGMSDNKELQAFLVHTDLKKLAEAK